MNRFFPNTAGCWPVAWALCLLFCLLGADPAWAEVGRGPVTVVALASRTDQPRSESVIGAVEGQLSDLPVVFHVSWAAESFSDVDQQRDFATAEQERLAASAVFWCAGSELFLLLPGGQLLSRTLEDSSGFSEVAAIIVRSAVQVLAEDPEGEQVLLAAPGWRRESRPAELPQEPLPPGEPPPPQESPPQEPPPPAAQPAPDQPEAPEARLGIRGGYALESWSSDHRANHGMTLDIAVRLYSRLWLAAGYTFFFPLAVDWPEGSFELKRHPISLGLRYDARVGRFLIGGSLCAVFDVMSQEVAADPPFEAVDHGPSLELSLSPAVDVAVRLFSILHLFVSVGVTIPWNRVEYVVDSGGVASSILVSWPVRFRALVGLSVELL